MQLLVKIGLIAIASSVHCAVAVSRSLGPANQVVRTIEDRSTGDRWVLERDRDHPGGPGRIVRLVGHSMMTSQEEKAKLIPVIRAGENVVVEEKNAIVQVRLEGVALGTAARGDQVTVKLKVGGWLVHAIAEAPGRAGLAEAPR